MQQLHVVHRVHVADAPAADPRGYEEPQAHQVVRVHHVRPLERQDAIERRGALAVEDVEQMPREPRGIRVLMAVGVEIDVGRGITDDAGLAWLRCRLLRRAVGGGDLLLASGRFAQPRFRGKADALGDVALTLPAHDHDVMTGRGERLGLLGHDAFGAAPGVLAVKIGDEKYLHTPSSLMSVFHLSSRAGSAYSSTAMARPASPMSRLPGASASTAESASESEEALPGETRRPVTPSRTIVRTPGRSLATTGSPDAAASRATIPKASERSTDGKAKTSPSR